MAAALPDGDRTGIASATLALDGGTSLWRSISFATAGVVAITFAAKAQIPFWPIPLTLQSLVVLVLGAAFGPALGGATVLLYLMAGLSGLPVFAGSGHGAPAFQGPTGGFLIGFLVATICVGWLVRRGGWGTTLASAAVAMLVGHAVLFVPGLVWLAHIVGNARAVEIGLSPFIAAIAFKIAVGAVLIRMLPRTH